MHPYLHQPSTHPPTRGQALNAATAEFDGIIRREKELVKRLGGLYVVGTARHESRRIDNQVMMGRRYIG